MDERRNSQLISLADALSRVIELDPKKVSDKIRKLNAMSDEEVINELAKYIYENFKYDSDLCDYFLSLIVNINPDMAKSAEFLKSKLQKLYINGNNGNDQMSLEENHKLVYDTFIYLAELFNREGIDYCFTGAVPCFIQKGIPLFRYHDDIDIMINEEDVEKVRSLMESSGYTFSDLRFPTIDEYHEMKNNKPPHIVMAQNPNNNFNIGFYTFRREEDYGITVTEYSQREKDGQIIVDRLERYYNPIGTSLRFGDVCDYHGIMARVCSIEDTYNIKGCNKRPKDVTDMEMLESYIDKDKLREIRRNSNTKRVVKNVTKEAEMKM